jgi:hypothetical protein
VWLALASSICPPVLHAPTIILIVALVLMAIAVVLNVSYLNRRMVAMVLLGVVQLSTLAF